MSNSESQRGILLDTTGLYLRVYSLRKMRVTGQTNLNLDINDLEAFPLTKKLSRWIRTYPQEVVPMCDQVLKEYVLRSDLRENHTKPL